MFEPRDLEAAFCGHCGEKLPRFGARLGFCTPCAQTYRKVVQDRSPAQGGRATVPAARDVHKDPLLALVLSTVFPGGGQIYNAHFIKAGLVFVTAPLVIPWLVGIADAYFSARKINERSDFSYSGAQPA